MNTYVDLLRGPLKNKPKSLRAARQKSSATPTDVYRMNYNESPYGPSKKALETLAESCKRSYVYPDWFSIELKKELAKLYEITIDHIATGAGSSALICMLGEIFLNEGDEVIFGDPTYEAFRDMINDYGATPVAVPLDQNLCFDLDAMYDAITPKTKMIIICNPNNPTGTMVDSKKVEAFIRKVPAHIITVVDEAYIEYVTRENSYSMIKLVKEEIEKPVIVLRTFSKIYGMAGLRVGYAICAPALVDHFNKSSHAWNLSYVGQVTATTAVKDQDYIHSIRDKMEVTRNLVTKQLKELGCVVYESQTNFLLFKTDLDPAYISSELAKEKILIGAPIGCNRVSLGTDEMNQKFITVLKKILNK